MNDDTSQKQPSQKITAEDIKSAKRIDAPLFYASGVAILATGNDFTLVFNRARPIENQDGSLNQQVAASEPVLILSITAQTAKDILLLLHNIIPAHEKEFGEIKTVFMRHLDMEMNKAK